MKSRQQELEYLIEESWNKLLENGYDSKLIMQYVDYVLEKDRLTQNKTI